MFVSEHGALGGDGLVLFGVNDASRRLCNASDGVTESDAPRRRYSVRVGRGSGNNGVSAQATVTPRFRGAEPRRPAQAERTAATVLL